MIFEHQTGETCFLTALLKREDGTAGSDWVDAGGVVALDETQCHNDRPKTLDLLTRYLAKTLPTNAFLTCLQRDHLLSQSAKKAPAACCEVCDHSVVCIIDAAACGTRKHWRMENSYGKATFFFSNLQVPSSWIWFDLRWCLFCCFQSVTTSRLHKYFPRGDPHLAQATTGQVLEVGQLEDLSNAKLGQRPTNECLKWGNYIFLCVV